MRSPQRLNDVSTFPHGNYFKELYALGFLSRLRAITMIKEQIQQKSQRLLFFQGTVQSRKLTKCRRKMVVLEVESASIVGKVRKMEKNK